MTDVAEGPEGQEYSKAQQKDSRETEVLKKALMLATKGKNKKIF